MPHSGSGHLVSLSLASLLAAHFWRRSASHLYLCYWYQVKSNSYQTSFRLHGIPHLTSFLLLQGQSDETNIEMESIWPHASPMTMHLVKFQRHAVTL